MKPRRTRSQPPVAPALDHKAIDERYGLEPVYEPQHGAPASAAGGAQFASVQCPYCGEAFDTLVDASAGSASYVEDCQICCQPIQFDIEVDLDGALGAVTVQRGD
jgi:hypothetical protein